MSGLSEAIGELFVKVRPDTSTFGDETKKGVDGALGGIQNASRAALAGVVAVGTGLYKVGAELDSAIDNLRTKTGATGTELAALESSLKSVATNVPASFDDVSIAVADTNRLLGLTGDELEARSTQFLQLANVTGEDLTGAISSATALFNQFNITGAEQEGVLNNLFQASQASGLSVTELADAVNKSGAVLAQFGLGVEESADLIALLAKNGVPATEVGRSLTRVLQKAAEAGVPAADALNFIGESIKNAGTEAEAAAIALDAFGPKAGPRLAQQIRDGTLSLDDFAASLGAGQDTIGAAAEDTADFAETFQKLKNQLAVALAPAAAKIFSAVGEAATNAAPALVGVATALTPLIVAFASLPTPVLGTIIGLLGVGAVLGKVIGPITAVIKTVKLLSSVLAANPYILIIAATIALVILIVKNWDTIKEVIGAALEVIVGYLKVALGFIQSLWNTVWGAIQTTIEVVWGVINTVITTYLDLVKLYIETVLLVITTIWNTAWLAVQTTVETVMSVVTTVIQTAVSIIGGILGGVQAVVDGVTGAFSGLSSGVAAAWDWIKTKTQEAVTFLKGLLSDLASAADRALGPLDEIIGGAAGAIGGLLGRASGGPVIAGRSYIVGEEGPELFTPGRTGGITPTDMTASLLSGASAGGGGMAVNGPLLYVGSLSVRDDRDVTMLARELATEADRLARGKGG